jgi:hypothetical protein
MTCYLVRYEYFLVFAARDPRPDGCLEPVEPGVWLDDGYLFDPRTGHPPAGLCAGQSPTDDRHYHLFRSPADRSRAGFHQVVGVPVVAPTWDQFLTAAAACGEPVA